MISRQARTRNHSGFKSRLFHSVKLWIVSCVEMGIYCFHHNNFSVRKAIKTELELCSPALTFNCNVVLHSVVQLQPTRDVQRVPQGQGLKCKKGAIWGEKNYRSKDWIHYYFIFLQEVTYSQQACILFDQNFNKLY